MTKRLLLGYLALTALVLAVLEIPLGVSYARNERGDLTTKVERDAVAMASLTQDALAKGAREADLIPVKRIGLDYAEDTGGRMVVVDRNGRALIDTSPLFGEGRDFTTRPEIGQALAGDVATGVRRSDTLGTDLLYVAVPVASQGRIHGVVRITYPTSAVDARVHRYWAVLAAIGGVVLAAAAVVGLALARSITRPLRDVERAAGALGAGELAARAPIHGPPEVRDLAHVFNETAAKLQALLYSQEQFVADASHELRTPLTALRLRLENLEEDIRPEGRESLEGAVVEAERLSRLVDGLLALARSDAADEASMAVDVRALADGRAQAWSALAEERGVRLETSGDGRAVTRAAPARLEQALDNLLANALDVSPHGGAIRVHVIRDGGWIELHVIDEGPGMTAEERERAFDRFWRGRNTNDGSGLGLALVKRLVSADNGAVTLHPAEPHGIDAIVRLPACATPRWREPGPNLVGRNHAPE